MKVVRKLFRADLRKRLQGAITSPVVEPRPPLPEMLVPREQGRSEASLFVTRQVADGRIVVLPLLVSFNL